jgi:uncharacterized protein YecT (DUF1311 family)
MAVVYLARELATDRLVAVKLLGARYAADPAAARRFAREARTVAGLVHPNVVRTLAIEELEGNAVAIVTEYVPGKTLRATLRESGPLPFERTAEILRDVANGLAYAHQYRIIHRDVKPENVFLHEATGRALLADFGIARQLDAETMLTAAGSSLGTPAYMAPEQIAGLSVDARTDVYALGLVGWEMLTGRRPWEGETLYAVLHRQQHESLPALASVRPDIPTYLLVAIEGAIPKSPASRWPDASTFLERLTPTPVALPPLRARPDEDEEVIATVSVDRPTREAPVEPPSLAEWGETPPIAVERVAAAHVAAEPVAARAVVSTPAAEPVTADPVSAEPVTSAPDARTPVPAAPWSVRDRPTAAAAPVAATSASSAHAEGPRPAWASAELRIAPPSSRGRRPRWLPAAAGLIAALLLIAVIAATRGRTLGGSGAQLDSLVNVVTSQSGGVVLRDSSGALAAPDSAPPGTPARPPTRSPARPGTARPSAPAAAVPTAPAANAGAVRAPGGICASARAEDQRACLMSRVSQNDIALTRAYQGLITRLRQQAGGVAEPPPVRALRVEQRAWIDQRDRTCRQRVPSSGAALWGVARAPCFAQLSDRRAATLRARAAAVASR